MKHPKRAPEGFHERLRVLRGVYLPAEAVLRDIAPRGAGRDDLLDALALAVTAHHGRLVSVSDEPQPGGHSLSMEIVFPEMWFPTPLISDATGYP